MHFFTIAAFAATAAALTITSPHKNTTVNLSKPTKIEWDSVESDPSTFSIELVNMNGYPNVHKKVAEHVKASDGSYTMKDIHVDNGNGFQINIIRDNDDKQDGILAQSEKFNVKGGSSKSQKNKSCSKTHTTKPTCTQTPTTTGTTNKTETTAPSQPSYTGGAGALAVPGMAGSVVLGVFLGVL